MEGVTTSVPTSFLGLVAVAGQATNWTLTTEDVLVSIKAFEFPNLSLNSLRYR